MRRPRRGRIGVARALDQEAALVRSRLALAAIMSACMAASRLRLSLVRPAPWLAIAWMLRRLSCSKPFICSSRPFVRATVVWTLAMSKSAALPLTVRRLPMAALRSACRCGLKVALSLAEIWSREALVAVTLRPTVARSKPPAAPPLAPIPLNRVRSAWPWTRVWDAWVSAAAASWVRSPCRRHPSSGRATPAGGARRVQPLASRKPSQLCAGAAPLPEANLHLWLWPQCLRPIPAHGEAIPATGQGGVDSRSLSQVQPRLRPADFVRTPECLQRSPAPVKTAPETGPAASVHS